MISVDWVEGARADEVAAGLAAYSAAGLLQVDAVNPTSTSSAHRAELLVAGMPVRLTTYQPIGLERACRVGRPGMPGRSGPCPHR